MIKSQVKNNKDSKQDTKSNEIKKIPKVNSDPKDRMTTGVMKRVSYNYRKI